MENVGNIMQAGLLGATGIKNYEVVQKPDGPHLVVKIPMEELKQMVLNSIDPQYKAFTSINIGPSGIMVDIKL